jgi:hypothetical protein
MVCKYRRGFRRPSGYRLQAWTIQSLLLHLDYAPAVGLGWDGSHGLEARRLFLKGLAGGIAYEVPHPITELPHLTLGNRP